MKIIKQSVEIIDDIDGEAILKKIEQCGRVAYQSGDRITDDSARRFVKMLIKRGHESVLEHVSITVSFICDRAIANELTRHRLASFTQESTRYCNYEGEISIVAPFERDENPDAYDAWEFASFVSEHSYRLMLGAGCKPEEARSALSLSLKTEVVATANLREWRHIFDLRTDKAAHPQMRALMGMLLERLREAAPVVFEDIGSSC